MGFYSRLGVHSSFDPSHKFVTSPFIRSPLTLALVRGGVALYTVVVLLVTLVWTAVKLHTGRSYFSYFTYLAYIGLCAYYWASSAQTVAYAIGWRKSGAGAGYPLQRWPKVMQALHIILRATVVTFAILVTIVFWALLASSSTFSTPYLAWSEVSIHALNTVFALFEIGFTNSPSAPWLTLPFCILALAGYLGVAYITHLTQGFYTYPFLNPTIQGPKLAGYIIGIAVAEIIIFCLIKGIETWRERWAVRRGLVLQVGSAVLDGDDDDEDWQQVERPSSIKGLP
jgi:hypothetical protein